MMRPNLLDRIRRNDRGAVAIEFALLAPAFFIMLFGVMQVAIAMQNYNALRNVSADVARYAMIQYQTGNELSNSQLESFAENHALGAPYLLDQARVNAIITTPNAANQRVTGATERRIIVTYQVESLLDFAGIDGPFLRYTRPVFLLDED